MSALPLLTRIPNRAVKTVTFDGGAGSGAVGTVAVGTVTGRILITHLSAFCSTTLVGAGTLALGVTGNTAGLIAEIADATDLAANDFWIDATPAEVRAATAILDKLVSGNIFLTVGSTDITAGVVEFSMLWLPMSADGNLAV